MSPTSADGTPVFSIEVIKCHDSNGAAAKFNDEESWTASGNCRHDLRKLAFVRTSTGIGSHLWGAE